MTSLTNRRSDCLKSLTSEELMVYNFRAYVSPLLAFIGIPANIFVIIIFNLLQRQQSCRFNLYAIWMALAHLVQLIVNTLIDDFLGRGLKWATDCYIWYQVDAYSSFTCKLLTYLSDVSALIASCILMLFSIDRVCSVYCSKPIEQILHLRIAKLSIFIIYVICFLLNIPHLIYADLKDDPKETVNCQYVDPVATGVKYVLYLYIIGVTILPAILIFIMNILISCKLKSTIQQSKLHGYHDKQSYSELSKVITHLAISIMFTCLSIPLVTLMILRQKVHFNNYELIYPMYAYKIIQLSKLFSSVDSFNHTFDFFLYWAFLPVFRQTLHDIIINIYSFVLCINHHKRRKSTIGNHNNNNSNNIIIGKNMTRNSNVHRLLDSNSNHHHHKLINNQMNSIHNNNNNNNTDNSNHCKNNAYDYDLSNLACYTDFPIGYCKGRCSPHHLYYYQHYRNHRDRPHQQQQHPNHQHHHRHRYYQYYEPHRQYYRRYPHKLYQLEYSKQLSFHCMEELRSKQCQDEQQQNQSRPSR